MDGLWDDGSYDVHRQNYPPAKDQNRQPEKWPTVEDTNLPQILCLFEVVLRLHDHLFLFVVLHIFGVVCPVCPLLSFHVSIRSHFALLVVSSNFVAILHLLFAEYLLLFVVLHLFRVICVICCWGFFLSLWDFPLSVCSCFVSLCGHVASLVVSLLLLIVVLSSCISLLSFCFVS